MSSSASAEAAVVLTKRRWHPTSRVESLGVDLVGKLEHEHAHRRRRHPAFGQFDPSEMIEERDAGQHDAVAGLDCQRPVRPAAAARASNPRAAAVAAIAATTSAVLLAMPFERGRALCQLKPSVQFRATE